MTKKILQRCLLIRFTLFQVFRIPPSLTGGSREIRKLKATPYFVWIEHIKSLNCGPPQLHDPRINVQQHEVNHSFFSCLLCTAARVGTIEKFRVKNSSFSTELILSKIHVIPRKCPHGLKSTSYHSTFGALKCLELTFQVWMDKQGFVKLSSVYRFQMNEMCYFWKKAPSSVHLSGSIGTQASLAFVVLWQIESRRCQRMLQTLIKGFNKWTPL